MSQIKINKGQILLYRVFDIASELNLSHVEQILNENWSTKGKRLKLDRDPHNTIIMKEAPLSVEVGEEKIKIKTHEFKATVSVKLWTYGACSVCVKIPIENLEWKELVDLACIFDDSKEIFEIAKNARDFIIKKISTLIKTETEFPIVEDYSTFIVEDFLPKMENPLEALKKVNAPELLLGENEIELAEITKKTMMKDVFQYSKLDLAMVDWNSCLIFDFSGKELYKDYVEIVEFSLSHLLELRVYDHLLDLKLSTLYDTIEEKNNNFLNKNYTKLLTEANQIFLEFSELVEHVDNSIKTVGNSPLALFFRETSREFRFSDWQHNLKEKMTSLSQVTQVLVSELNSKKSHVMELTIVILILIEVVPLVYSWIRPLF